jgi:hypothetical protein
MERDMTIARASMHGILEDNRSIFLLFVDAFQESNNVADAKILQEEADAAYGPNRFFWCPIPRAKVIERTKVKPVLKDIWMLGHDLCPAPRFAFISGDIVISQNFTRKLVRAMNELDNQDNPLILFTVGSDSEYPSNQMPLVTVDFRADSAHRSRRLHKELDRLPDSLHSGGGYDLFCFAKKQPHHSRRYKKCVDLSRFPDFLAGCLWWDTRFLAWAEERHYILLQTHFTEKAIHSPHERQYQRDDSNNACVQYNKRLRDGKKTMQVRDVPNVAICPLHSPCYEARRGTDPEAYPKATRSNGPGRSTDMPHNSTQ